MGAAVWQCLVGEAEWACPEVSVLGVSFRRPVAVGFGAVAVSGQGLEAVDTGLAVAAVGVVGTDVVEVEPAAGPGAERERVGGVVQQHSPPHGCRDFGGVNGCDCGGVVDGQHPDPGAFQQVLELAGRDRADAFDPGDTTPGADGPVADVEEQGLCRAFLLECSRSASGR